MHWMLSPSWRCAYRRWLQRLGFIMMTALWVGVLVWIADTFQQFYDCRAMQPNVDALPSSAETVQASRAAASCRLEAISRFFESQLPGLLVVELGWALLGYVAYQSRLWREAGLAVLAPVGVLGVLELGLATSMLPVTDLVSLLPQPHIALPLAAHVLVVGWAIARMGREALTRDSTASAST